jgi:translation initiation factor 3 subunit M
VRAADGHLTNPRRRDSIPAAADREAVALDIAQTLAASTDCAPARLRILSALYFASECKFQVFVALARYATKVNLGASLELEGALELAGKDAGKTREMQLVLAQAWAHTDPAKSQRCLLSYLEMCSPADAEAVPFAKEAALNAIRDPLAAVNAQILRLGPVQALQKSEPAVFALLSAVCSGSIKTFEQFASANPKCFDSAGLNRVAVEEKMRLLALATLASSKQGEVVTYAQVAAALAVDGAQVEAWVVRATGAGVIDCKMDQEKQTIVVNSVALRAFEDSQWSSVAAQLKKWRMSVRGVLQAVQAAREDQERRLVRLGEEAAAEND